MPDLPWHAIFGWSFGLLLVGGLIAVLLVRAVCFRDEPEEETEQEQAPARTDGERTLEILDEQIRKDEEQHGPADR